MNLRDMTSRLNFRRMFVLTQEPIEANPNWKCLRKQGLFVYTHSDLDVNFMEDGKKSLIMIGDMYDPHAPQQGNAEILGRIHGSINSVEECIAQIKHCAGCFALIFIGEEESYVFHDARGLREIFYCSEKNRVICASQPNLITEFADPPLKWTNDIELLDFYENHLRDSRWVGDETVFTGIKHLLPNHLLDIGRRQPFRYWPNKVVGTLSLQEGVCRISDSLQGMLKAIVHRHPAMMALTAGTDSRILLAASKGLENKIYYFVNNCKLGSRHPDIIVPQSICKGIGVKFHVHDVPEVVNDEFRRIFYKNTFLAAERILPSIYDLHFRKYGERVLILGVSEIGRTFYGKEPTSLTGYHLAYKLGYPECRYVNRQCEQMVEELQSVARKSNLNSMALVYWEQRLGNWGAVRNSESLLAIDKVDPFNSHFIYETFLAVDESFRSYDETPCAFCGELIQNMWPELLEWPINPPYGFQDKTKALLSKLHLLDVLRMSKYYSSFVKYRVRKLLF